MTLLRYLGVRAGARPRVGAGAGADVGANKNTCMNTDLTLFKVFRLRHVTFGFLKKRRNYFNCCKNKIDPASLAVTDQLICSQGKQRLTLGHVPFCDMIFQSFFSINFCYIWHTQISSFSWGFLHLRLSELCLYDLHYIVLLNLLCHFVAHQHGPWANYSLQWSFHN